VSLAGSRRLALTWGEEEVNHGENTDAADVFVYTGIGEGAIVPQDVAHVRIDPSVLVIPEGVHAQENNFGQKYKLETIEFHDEVREIYNWAFFECTSLKEVKLSDGILSIGDQAFSGCTFTKFRSPPLVTEINGLDNCQSLFSLELPDNNIQVGGASFNNCHSLRNVAFTSNTWFDRTFYTFSTRRRQLQMHPRSDLMGFQFTASSTSNLTTIK
jgi:hypothetical protein